MKTPEQWAKQWCICESYWAKYGKTDPRCRHEEIEEIVERVQAEALGAAAKAVEKLGSDYSTGVYGEQGDWYPVPLRELPDKIRALKEAT